MLVFIKLGLGLILHKKLDKFRPTPAFLERMIGTVYLLTQGKAIFVITGVLRSVIKIGNL